MVVVRSPAFPVIQKGYVHQLSIAFEPKYADFQADASTKIETFSMQEYIFQP